MRLAPLKVPANVVSNVRRRWPELSPDWSSCAENELNNLCARYGATVRTVLPARYGFVVAVETAHGGGPAALAGFGLDPVRATAAMAVRTVFT